MPGDSIDSNAAELAVSQEIIEKYQKVNEIFSNETEHPSKDLLQWHQKYDSKMIEAKALSLHSAVLFYIL